MNKLKLIFGLLLVAGVSWGDTWVIDGQDYPLAADFITAGGASLTNAAQLTADNVFSSNNKFEGPVTFYDGINVDEIVDNVTSNMIVSSFGYSAFNGMYDYIDLYQGKPRYYKTGETRYRINWTAAGEFTVPASWWISDTQSNNSYYSLDNVATPADVTKWIRYGSTPSQLGSVSNEIVTTTNSLMSAAEDSVTFSVPILGTEDSFFTNITATGDVVAGGASLTNAAQLTGNNVFTGATNRFPSGIQLQNGSIIHSSYVIAQGGEHAGIVNNDADLSGYFGWYPTLWGILDGSGLNAGGDPFVLKVTKDSATLRLIESHGVWRSEGDATNGTEIVNYQTMTGMNYAVQNTDVAFSNLTANTITATVDVVAGGASLTNTAALAGTAWQNPPNATNFTWTTNATLTEITITSWKGTGGNDVVIPDYIDGLPVTAIGQSSFAGSDITSLSAGINVKKIGESAFQGCAFLVSASLPSVTSIEKYAFSFCPFTSISLPAVQSIGEYAFYFCSNLTNVTFSANAAPTTGSDIFMMANQVTVYIDNPTATGWGTLWNGQPVVRLGVTADSYAITGNRIAIPTATEIPTNATYTISYSNGQFTTYSFGAGTNDLTITIEGPGAEYRSQHEAYWASGYTNRPVTWTNTTGALNWINAEPTTSEAQIMFIWTGTNAAAINTTVTQ